MAKHLPSRISTRSIAFCALAVALLSVSAWVAIPIGPVPVTLQTFAIIFILVALSPGQAISAIALYILAGAVGLPVFSGMRAGLGILLGPTGGFLWGFLLAAAISLACKHLLDKALIGANTKPNLANRYASAGLSAFIFMVVAYLAGWFQLQIVAYMGPEQAFVVAVLPFVVFDLIKMVLAIGVAVQLERFTRPN